MHWLALQNLQLAFFSSYPVQLYCGSYPPYKSMDRLKIFDDDLIHCTIDTISLVDKKHAEKTIVVLTRTIIRLKNKFFTISKIANKESESADNMLNRPAIYCFMP